jgi:hypothetical protein
MGKFKAVKSLISTRPWSTGEMEYWGVEKRGGNS